MKTFIDYDHNMKRKYKNSIIIMFSSYFHILEERVGNIFSCTCISKNVFKYAMLCNEVKELPLIDH
jgi:hypothetical protein